MIEATDFGVVGDGVTMNTKAIQKALDTGEIVHFSEGTYLSGTIYLRSGGGIDLDENAVLKASASPEDYNPDDISIHNAFSKKEKVSGAHFLYAEGQNNLVLRGKGCISGNGRSFFDAEKMLGDSERPYYQVRGWRPGQMLYFYDCKNITIRDLQLEDAPYWNCLFHNCEEVLAENIRIHSDRKIINTDGFDIDCSRRVSISGCQIDCGDDCVAIRANETPVGHAAPCTDVRVENCVFTSPACAVRIGVGNGTIRNVVLKNLEISGSTIGIGICPCYSVGKCVQMEDIRIESCRIDAKQALILVPYWGVTAKKIQGKTIRNIRFISLDMTSRMPCIFVAPDCNEKLYGDFFFEKIKLNMKTPLIPPLSYHWPLSEFGGMSFLRFTPEKIDVHGESSEYPLILFR